MNKILPFLLGILVSASVFAQTDLFFSEYVEGSGNNKGLEIYNPTKNSIDLTKYYIARFSNGGTTYTSGGVTQLKGTLAPYKTFVFINGQVSSTESSPACDPILQAKADQLDGAYPAPTYMNGNDAMALLKTETGDLADALPVDLIGEIGQGSKISAENGWAPFTDTTIVYKISDVEYSHTITDHVIKSTDDTKAASYGPYWLAWTQDHTLRRKYSVYEGVKANPDTFNPSIEWDTVSVIAEGVDAVTQEVYTYRKYKDIWDDLGKHECIVTDPGFIPNSVKTVGTATLNVFPTLVENKTISVSSSEVVSTVQVYDLNGKLVFTPKFKPATTVQLNVSSLRPGMYLLKTTTANQSQRSLRIVVK